MLRRNTAKTLSQKVSGERKIKVNSLDVGSIN